MPQLMHDVNVCCVSLRDFLTKMTGHTSLYRLKPSIGLSFAICQRPARRNHCCQEDQDSLGLDSSPKRIEGVGLFEIQPSADSRRRGSRLVGPDVDRSEETG